MLKTLRTTLAYLTSRIHQPTGVCPNGACSHVGYGVAQAGAGSPLVCAVCRAPLPDSQQNSLSPFSVVILGGTSSGKTVWLLHSLTSLFTDSAQPEGRTVQFALPDQLEQFTRSSQAFKMGRWPTATSPKIPTALCFNVTTSERTRLLYMYDPAGTECRDSTRLLRHRYLQHLRGVVFVIDPFVLPRIREQYATQLKYTRTKIRPSATPTEEVIAAFVHTWHQVGSQERIGPRHLPLAVVLSKTEAFDLGRQIDEAKGSMGTEPQACRQSLIAWGGAHTVRALEHHFRPISYFRYRGGVTGAQSPQAPVLWLMDTMTNIR